MSHFDDNLVQVRNGKQMSWNWLLWCLLGAVLIGVTVAFLVRQAGGGWGPVAQPGFIDPRVPLSDFTLTEAGGQPLGRANLLGKVWIADFIFTHCAGPCPLMSQKMKRLQDDLSDLADLRLVSFSVDPLRDTPEVLRSYGQGHQADPQRWFFLTGDMDRIYDLAIKGFKITVEEARRDQQIIHDTRFILVDREGLIRGYFDSNEPGALQELAVRARDLCSR